MTMHVKVSGSWKEVPEAFVKVSGAWKQILAGYVKVSGVWKPFYGGGTVTVSGEFIGASSGSGPVTAKLLINPDGTLDKDENGVVSQIDSGTDWIIPNSAASPAYQVRITNVVGSLSGATTLTEDVWAPIDQQHVVGVIKTAVGGPGQQIATFDLEIRLGGSGAAVDSGSFTLEAELI